jgi:hypothetical protein
MQVPKIDLIPFMASSFAKYITLEGLHPSRTYDYAKRGFSGLPVIDCTRHQPKCKQGESWLYVAISAGANFAELGKDEKLYVGSQTQDRMFRGDGLSGDNYHHAEMRRGNGADNPVNFLRAGRKIEIHRIAAEAIAAIVANTPELHFLSLLAQQPRTARSHLGYWFEQYMLWVEPPPLWRWNAAPANKALLRTLGGGSPMALDNAT